MAGGFSVLRDLEDWVDMNESREAVLGGID